MEDKPVCPFCGYPAGKKGFAWQFYGCGTVKNLKTNEYEQDFQCLKLQLATLQAQADEIHDYLKRLFACIAPQCKPFEETIHLCTQIDNYIAGINEKNKELQVQVAGIKGFDLEKFIRGLPWSNDTPDIHKTLVAGNLRNLFEKITSFLSSTPAGEWISVRRDAAQSLKRLWDAEGRHYQNYQAISDQLKAALGTTGGKE